jgi:hypothetical protein
MSRPPKPRPKPRPKPEPKRPDVDLTEELASDEGEDALWLADLARRGTGIELADG